jgi:chromosome segregation ATPase
MSSDKNEKLSTGTPGPSFASSTPLLSVRARRALFETTLGARRSNIPHIPLVNSAAKDSNSPLKQQRRPLGFLSPNFLKQQHYRPGFQKRLSTQRTPTNEADNTTTGDDTVSQLQQEISNLQYRLESLDVSHVFRNPERPVSADNVTENEVLEFTLSPQDYQHVKELNQKLQQIQTGLLDIEGERHLLVTRGQQLEQEKAQLAQQLGVREREIETLQKRCAAAAEQSKQTTAVRATNEQLESELKELRSQQSACADEHVVRIMELQVQLQECQASRDEIAHRLQNVQRDRDGVCESLVQCLASLEELKKETSEWEAERERMQEEHEAQLELQRVDHLNAIEQLREELKSRETKVKDLDRLLQDKIMSIARLRNQLTNLEASQADTITRMTSEYERTIQTIAEEHEKALAHEVESKLQDIVNQCREQELSFAQDEINILQEKLSEKNAEIESLRNDVSIHMQELMTTTTELQKLQEDSAMLDGLFQDVETLECERHSLSEKLHEKDTEIAELSAEILKLEIEKELAGQESLNAKALNDKLEAAERENESSIQRLHEVEAAYQSLANEIRRINSDNDETVTRIRSEYDAAICDLQRKLQRVEMASQTASVIHTETVAAKDKAIANLLEQMSCIKADYQTELSSLHDEIERAKTALAAQQQDQVRNALDDRETIRSLKAELARTTADLQANEVNASSHIARLELEVRRWHTQALDLDSQIVVSTLEHQAEADNLKQSLDDLRRDNGNLRRTIQDNASILEETVSRHKQSSVNADNRIDQLEDQVRQLQATIADLENSGKKIASDHQREVESLARKISDLQSGGESSRSQAETKKKEYESVIEKLNQSVADIRRERDFSQMSLAGTRRKLEEESAQLALMTRSHKEVAASERALQEEYKQLRLTLEDVRNERDTLILGMEREIYRRDSGQEEALRNELALAEQKLIDHEQQMATLEEALQERTKLLADMVAHNKELQAKVDRSDHEFRVMEERSSTLQVRLLDREDELRHLRTEWQEKEDDYLGRLHCEHNLRVLSETDLAAATQRLETLRLEGRDLMELEKENAALKDKIRRQEAFLQRKIEQDKAARDRGVPGSALKVPASAAKPMATARGNGKVTSRGTPPSLAQGSKATRSTIPETESLDVELESLLAD